MGLPCRSVIPFLWFPVRTFVCGARACTQGMEKLRLQLSRLKDGLKVGQKVCSGGPAPFWCVHVCVRVSAGTSVISPPPPLALPRLVFPGHGLARVNGTATKPPSPPPTPCISSPAPSSLCCWIGWTLRRREQTLSRRSFHLAGRGAGRVARVLAETWRPPACWRPTTTKTSSRKRKNFGPAAWVREPPSLPGAARAAACSSPMSPWV
jgi:hypothetical protein